MKITASRIEISSKKHVKTPEEKKELDNMLNIIKQAILLKKSNIIGLKMRIYMERQKACNSLEFLRKIQESKIKSTLNKSEFEYICILNQKIKEEIEDMETIKQYHSKMDAATS
mmetsp:Transcript_23421/g.23377  ORF Transcript_23421/g.23377 Transcript_23421/m.23377 type:complete len:114 (+) Transcript_23421:1505-1846(+)